MGNPKLTYLLIACVFISGIAAIFGIYITKTSDAYGDVINPDTTSIELYNKLDNLQNISEEIKQSTTKISQPTGILDFIGGLFSSGYLVLKSIPSELGLITEFVNLGIDDSNLGEGASIIKTVLMLSFVFLLFLGVILAIVLGRVEVV